MWFLTLFLVLTVTAIANGGLDPLRTLYGIIPKLRRALVPRQSAAMSKTMSQMCLILLSTCLTFFFACLLDMGLGYSRLAPWVITPCLCLTYFGFYTLATTSGVSVNRVLARGFSFLRGGGELKSYLLRLTSYMLWEATFHSKNGDFVVFESSYLLISFLCFVALFGQHEDVLEFARLVDHHLSITVGVSVIFGHFLGAAFSFVTLVVATEILREGNQFPCGLDDPEVAKAEALEEGLEENEGEEPSNKALKVVVCGGASERVVVRGGASEIVEVDGGASEIVEVDEDVDDSKKD